MTRPTNQELCDAFRALLIDKAAMSKAAQTISIDCIVGNEYARSDGYAHFLRATKDWRGDIWRAFAEIERRLCPQPESKNDET